MAEHCSSLATSWRTTLTILSWAHARRSFRTTITAATMLSFVAGPVLPAFAQQSEDRSDRTATPIKHIIVIIGENRTFDHVFATYQPKSGERVNNLLSEGIVTADGKPGPNYKAALQYSATDSGTYSQSPSTKT